MTIKLTDPIFSDPDKAREHLESLLWPQGPFCPRCGEMQDIRKLQGKTNRPGLYQCNPCHRSFSVTVNTVMERSHIPVTAWVAAFHIYCASKKGFSAHQLHRQLGITYKSAWFLAHRVREAMGDSNPEPMGTGGATVEVDETFIGRNPAKKRKSGAGHKMAVLSLVERGTGKARSFHIDDLQRTTIEPIMRKNLTRGVRLMTDDAPRYVTIGREGFASHGVVNHTDGEYVRGDIHTNTVEGFFSIFKRGMKGVYQHCSTQHLHRYLAEFDFRYSNRMANGVDDLMRTMRAIKGAQGKRLTYRQAGRKAA